ncbi:FUSC family protein [Streptomyces sp. NPDC058417]|uniref:FUSC family protein n=1 Tax=unclassified Streptomyces TaxID=2593676 RepID=UPI00364B01A5
MPPRSAVAVRTPTALPPWLAHALRAQRGPLPWSAVVRGALAAGPLLLTGLLVGRTSLGVVAAIAAMLAGINDRPGSRRSAIRRIGAPALAGASGLLVGSVAGDGLGPVGLTFALTGLGLLAGGASAVGPVASAAGTQVLVGAAIGAGMPLPGSAGAHAAAFLAGAGWLLLLRLALPTPGAPAGAFRLDGERTAVADVYDAVADLLEAAGTGHAAARRAALTAALDHAQDALAGPRLLRLPGSATERRLRAQYAAALPLAEAATALAWSGQPLTARACAGSRRLAVAVRENTAGGPLPAPARSAPALRALDDALLRAADAFDGSGARTDGGPGTGADLAARPRGVRRAREVLRAAAGTGGREYGTRVALGFGVSAAVAQALHHTHWYGAHPHWYWLPVTAVFLVKPDLGPLVSRVLCRAAGTVLGALLFAGLAALLPHPQGLVLLVALCGALIPVSTRHFAAQTAVVTVLVLSLVMVGGEPQASAGRIGETLLACVIVLVVGHLPMPGERGGRVRARLTAATAAAHAYVVHVLDGSGDRATRWLLRREAYRTLAEARGAIALAAAELPALARHTEGTDEVAALLERLVDTTTAAAVHLDDAGRLDRPHRDRLDELLRELADTGERVGLPGTPGTTAASTP